MKNQERINKNSEEHNDYADEKLAEEQRNIADQF